MNFDLLNAISHLEKPDGLIALPGLEVYYLAARPTQARALARLRRVTRQTESFLLLGADQSAFDPYIEQIPAPAQALMNQHWPGPLQIELPASACVLPSLSGEAQRVRLMLPESPVLRALRVLLPEGVLAVCPASRWGESSTLSAQAVYDSFGEDVDFVLSGDEWVQSAPVSTVVSVAQDGEIHLLRSGYVVLD